jgi:hypothetical protein
VTRKSPPEEEPLVALPSGDPSWSEDMAWSQFRRPSPARPTRPTRLTLEQLEDRTVPAVFPSAPEFLVSSADKQNDVASAATDAQGNSVIVWAHYGDTAHAQRYNAAGIPVGGSLALPTVGDPKTTDVAMNASGAFVVVWSA